MSAIGQEGDAVVSGHENELRHRLLRHPALSQRESDSHAAKETVSDLNAKEVKSDKSEDKKRIYGRTPDGTGNMPLN
jgi:hypothetical protein